MFSFFCNDGDNQPLLAGAPGKAAPPRGHFPFSFFGATSSPVFGTRCGSLFETTSGASQKTMSVERRGGGEGSVLGTSGSLALDDPLRDDDHDTLVGRQGGDWATMWHAMDASWPAQKEWCPTRLYGMPYGP
jgi:hypothetical protein